MVFRFFQCSTVHWSGLSGCDHVDMWNVCGLLCAHFSFLSFALVEPVDRNRNHVDESIGPNLHAAIL